MGLFDFTKYDADAPGAPVDEATRLELRRIANLFLVSSVTLLVLLVEVFARSLSVTFIPATVYAAAGFVFLFGWAATYVYGIYTTYKARRWGWFALCVVPITTVPACVAYSWIRRGEIEREVLGDPAPSPARQRRGGRNRR